MKLSRQFPRTESRTASNSESNTRAPHFEENNCRSLSSRDTARPDATGDRCSNGHPDSLLEENMDEEGERIRNLTDSVEKEMARKEETRREAGAVRRQLFSEEEIIRPIDSIESDVEEEDMVEEIDHNTDSAQSADEELDAEKNKREVPPIFLQSRSMENSSVFGFTKDKTLLYYCPKKKKMVLLLSTMHHINEIDPDSEESRKPYMLTFYNSTKGGVDMVDEYKARYSVARTSNRWPLTLFFTLLNIAGINSFIILKHNIRQFDMFRRKFLQTLSKELSRNYLLERLQLENLPCQLKRNIREITGTAEERNPPPSGEDEGPGRCHLCDWKKNLLTCYGTKIVLQWLKEGKMVINKISQLGPMDPSTNSRCGPPDIGDSTGFGDPARGVSVLPGTKLRKDIQPSTWCPRYIRRKFYKPRSLFLAPVIGAGLLILTSLLIY
ncbi:hypothetical protein ANN_14027 [Periplaneta americana]|uniref:PiggyBac transposable element-derived protein domain-containing protein n=1 Tax=Periplaneta americana TaxID=6978 RepID=A0ABQ8SV54_PERAM|nr:hypothetical protein ANN_14027 [Periplaneta americana]